MEQIIITKPNGNRVPMQSRRTATDVTAAKQSWVLNGDDTVDITVKSPFRQTYDIGDKITIFGRDYTLNRLSKPKKTGMHEFEYSLQFEGVQYDLLRASYDVTIDTTNNELQDVQGDSLTGDLRRFLTVLVANANRVFPGKWALGVCPETKSDITKTFGESDNCLSVLQSILGEFDESYFFDIQTIGGVYTINIRSTSQTLPFTLEFGKGNGLYMLSRDNVSSSNIVTRLKVYGSASNITSKYRADRLCLPGKTKGQSYIEDAQAVARYGIFEGRKHFDNIKPTFTGHVQAVGDSVCEFIDPTISFDLNAVEPDGKTTVYLIDGVSAKVHFNSGNLAGYEFEIAKYDHATHKVTLRKFTDDRGDVFPSETSAAFQFRASDGTYSGDEYKIVDIALPQELVDKAEAELLEAGQKYYEQNSQPKVQYSLSVTKAFIEKNFATDAGVVNVFVPGDYVRVKDDDIGVDKAVRIKSITRNVLDPYDYSLNLSDTVTTTVTNRVLSDLIDIDKIIEINNLKDPARARANWRSSREVLDMVFDPEGDYYTDKIKPNSIDTLALSVGAKSMQFGLTNTVFQPNYNGNPKLMRWQGGVLTHYTINEDSAVSWVLGDGQITLSPDSQPFYIYARCHRVSSAGQIAITTRQYRVDEDANYYWFWIGVINSVDPDIKARSIALTYGFTMINGRFIKTGRIESADGETYFDLDNSEIGGRIVFNSNGQEKTLEELGQEALESKDFINNTLPGLLSELQSQLDGVVEQWFYSVDPLPLNTNPQATANEPASDWTTSEDKEKHLGDLYYNTETGKVWRYVKILWSPAPNYARATRYVWKELEDTELAQALALAQDALDTANTKARIFVDTPYPPYSVGDLWVQGASGDIYRCKTARDSGSFTSSDWEKASKYTDDSALNAFINNNFANTVSNLETQIDGKVETWFQVSDPATSWTTNELKQIHVGDMWYNTNTKELKYYKRLTNNQPYTFGWQLVEDAKAIAAYEAASQAQDTADGKRQVFVSTPYPPYDIGDLWVDGKELRRCITAKAKGQSYNVNDWVIAVYYDNTKTTIDGGIVTSGTIQVAGDNASILAGMTGQGTAATSIRFWAGASFENRATAPYRVLQDGSFYATKANITGTINANAGSIGGFNISSGKIGYGTSSEQDTTHGLALLSSFIRFYNGDQRTLVGCLNSLGYPYNGLFELNGSMGTALEVHHKFKNTTDSDLEHWYLPKALAVYGNQYNLGKVAFLEKGYIGQIYSDIIQSYFAITHKYHFTSNPNSRTSLYLPTKTTINNRTGDVPVIFDVEIVCDWNMANTVVLTSQTGAQIYNQNGGTVSTVDLAKGDSINLRYYNGGWVIINRYN
ncbi:MAG: hypothetical protein NC401_04200 [Ruminococcus sp.]|nr:hypothetical protein [Ruminococcus sp.]